MNRIRIANELLKVAKDLVGIEFDTKEEMEEYKRRHKVKPTTKLEVKPEGKEVFKRQEVPRQRKLPKWQKPQHVIIPTEGGKKLEYDQIYIKPDSPWFATEDKARRALKEQGIDLQTVQGNSKWQKENLSLISNQTNRLSESVPEVKKMFQSPDGRIELHLREGPIDRVKEFGQEPQEVGDRPMGLCVYDLGQSVVYVAEAARRPDYYRFLSPGSFITDFSSTGRFIHELGHAFWYHYRLGKEWDDVVSQIDQTEILTKISVYAATNSKETFAEAFVAWTHPLYKEGGLPKLIEDFMKKHAPKKEAKQ